MKQIASDGVVLISIDDDANNDNDSNDDNNNNNNNNSNDDANKSHRCIYCGRNNNKYST